MDLTLWLDEPGDAMQAPKLNKASAAKTAKLRKGKKRCRGEKEFNSHTIQEPDWSLLLDSRPLSVGSDCCGWLSEAQALERLRIPHRHRFASDCSSEVHELVLRSFQVDTIYNDINSEHRAANLVPVDLYCAGFPCQPFSLNGSRLGLSDTRGTIFFSCAEYLLSFRPKCFLFENVAGLSYGKHKVILKQMIDILEDLCITTPDGRTTKTYNVHHTLLSSNLHGGVPQNRKRVFIIGIRVDCDRHTFEWPCEIPCQPLQPFLKDIISTPAEIEAARIKRTQNTRMRNLAAAETKLKQLGKDLWDPKQHYVIDVDAGQSEAHVMEDICPCITHCRGGSRGFFASWLGRCLTVSEMMALQAADPARFQSARQHMSASALGKIIGNAMTISCIERILAKLLPAASLVADTLQDPYVD